MLGWFRALMPREERFFDLFEQHARTVVAGADALHSMLQGGSTVAEYAEQVMKRENEADDITRDVLLAVRRSFITPFDRSDIKDLITVMDNSIDEMNSTAKAVSLYEVRQFEPGMPAMGEIVKQCARLMAEAVPLLASMNKSGGRIIGIGQEIANLENRADDIYNDGLKALLKAHGPAHETFIVGAKLFDRLEEVIDSLDDVADVMSGIVIAHS